MTRNLLQNRLATAALFFLPLTALNLGISLTIGDVLLIPAVLLNLRYVARLPFAVLFLLSAVPLVLLSTFLDRDADWISVGQALYIFCFVLPFGWCAFTDLTPSRIASTLVAGGVCSAAVAIGQFVGIVPKLPSQQMVEYFGGKMVRVSGLVISVNDLAQSLAALPVLLVLVTPKSVRMPAAFAIVVGLCCTVSKQAGFGLASMLWYGFRERLLQQFRFAFPLIACLLFVGYFCSENIAAGAAQFIETVEYRISYLTAANGDRLALIDAGLDSLSECLIIGYGTNGASEQMRHHHLTENVHVYFIGTGMIAGVPCALLLTAGYFSTLIGLLKHRLYTWSVYIAVMFLILQCHTVTEMSSQSVPLMVAIAVLSRSNFPTEIHAKILGKRKPMWLLDSRQRIHVQPIRTGTLGTNVARRERHNVLH